MSNLRKISLILFAGILCLQLFARVGSSARAQEPVPTIPAPGISVPPYLEPTPVKEDVEPGSWIFQPNGPDASGEEGIFLDGHQKIHGLIYYDGFLWASTRSAPAKIAIINPTSSPMSVVNSITLSPNRNNAEDIVAANGYIWSIATETDDPENSGSSYLVRVNPTTLSVGYLLIRQASNFLFFAESMEYKFGYLWIGGYNGIAKIDISNPSLPSVVAVYYYPSLITQPYMLGTALTSDENYLWTMFTQGTSTDFITTTLVRINPNDPTGDYLHEGLDALFPDDMVSISDNLYTSSELSGIPSVAYRFPISVTPYNTQTAFSYGISYGVFSNPLELDTFWGVYTGTPGTLIKFDLNLNQVISYTLPSGFDDPSEITFDPNGNMYVSTFQDPAGLVKYTVPEAVTLSISRSGSDAVLSWTNSDSMVDHYEIWRSTDPYFTPQGNIPYDTVPASVGSMSYTDFGAIGDVNNNYYYVVRAFNQFGLLAPISNRVGKFDFTIVRDRFNTIAIPLTDSSLVTADDLGFATGATTVSRWVASTQGLSTRTVGVTGFNFPITTGRGYFIYTPGTGPTLLSLVGDVPPIAGVTFSISRGVGNCLLNLISLPLDQPGLTNADALANSIGGVPAISRWSAAVGGFTTRTVGVTGVNFPTRIGYPYWPCADNTGGGSTWP